MYRRSNRASFLGRPGSSSLAKNYGKLVAIEIAMKDHMGAAATASYSHNLPHILVQYAGEKATAMPPIPGGALQSKSIQLANLLRSLTCMDKQGTRMKVPPHSYPYMRYVMHELDGNDLTDAKETDIEAIGVIADDIIGILSTSYQVAL